MGYTYNLAGEDMVHYMTAVSCLAAEWDEQLEEMSGQISLFCERTSFRGELADSAKAYMKEVHVMPL